MNNKSIPIRDPDQPTVCQIKLRGHLGQQWTDWFDGMTITLEDNGDTLITGLVIDQAMLHGLLKKVRDMGMRLISVNCIEPESAEGAAKLPVVDLPPSAFPPAVHLPAPDDKMKPTHIVQKRKKR